MALSPSSQSGYGPSGLSAVYYLSVHNKGLNTDTYDLSAAQNSWGVTFYDASGTSVITQAGPVAAADSLTIQAWVAVPVNAQSSDIDTALVTATSINDMVATATSLIATTSAGPPGGFPWYEPFPTASIDTVRWIYNHGATVSGSSLNPPSAPYAVNLDGGIDTLASQLIDLSGQSGVILSFSYERGGSADAPESGEDLWVEYKNNLGDWVEAAHYLGSGPVMGTFASVNLGLPSDAYHSNFQLRLRSFGSGAGQDNWYVDDIRVDYAPSMTTSPASMSENLAPQDSVMSPLIIGNDGPGSLIWTSRVQLTLNKSSRFAQLQAAGEVAPARRNYPAEYADYQEPKGMSDTRTGYPADKNAGGPDLFGYVWIDSDEPGGPVFAWQEVSGTGTDVASGLGDDNFVGPISLGMDFTFYGNTYHQVYIGSNGIIGFDTTGMSSRFKTPLPTLSTPNNLLAWLWDDLNPLDADNLGAHVWVDTTGGRCVIEFVNYPEYGANPGDVITAEVILHADGSIVYQYKTIAPGFDILANAVGIENSDGTDGLEVSYLNSYLHDSLAVQISAPYRWLTTATSGGTLASGEADTVACWFHSGDLAGGTYQAQIIISSNDPSHNPYPIDATLTVSTAPTWICGDIDSNGVGPDIGDLIYLVDYMFSDPQGPPPPETQAADANGDGSLDVSDLIYMADYSFNAGPAPTCGL